VTGEGEKRRPRVSFRPLLDAEAPQHTRASTAGWDYDLLVVHLLKQHTEALFECPQLVAPCRRLGEELFKSLSVRVPLPARAPKARRLAEAARCERGWGSADGGRREWWGALYSAHSFDASG